MRRLIKIVSESLQFFLTLPLLFLGNERIAIPQAQKALKIFSRKAPNNPFKAPNNPQTTAHTKNLSNKKTILLGTLQNCLTRLRGGSFEYDGYSSVAETIADLLILAFAEGESGDVFVSINVFNRPYLFDNVLK